MESSVTRLDFEEGKTIKLYRHVQVVEDRDYRLDDPRTEKSQFLLGWLGSDSPGLSWDQSTKSSLCSVTKNTRTDRITNFCTNSCIRTHAPVLVHWEISCQNRLKGSVEILHQQKARERWYA